MDAVGPGPRAPSVLRTVPCGWRDCSGPGAVQSSPALMEGGWSTGKSTHPLGRPVPLRAYGIRWRPASAAGHVCAPAVGRGRSGDVLHGLLASLRRGGCHPNEYGPNAAKVAASQDWWGDE